MSSTDQLLDTLIGQISKLTESVDRLVIIDAAREERDKTQEKENIRFNKFILDNSEPLIRVKRTQERYDRWGDKIGLAIIIAILAASSGSCPEEINDATMLPMSFEREVPAITSFNLLSYSGPPSGNNPCNVFILRPVAVLSGSFAISATSILPSFCSS